MIVLRALSAWPQVRVLPGALSYGLVNPPGDRTGPHPDLGEIRGDGSQDRGLKLDATVATVVADAEPEGVEDLTFQLVGSFANRKPN